MHRLSRWGWQWLVVSGLFALVTALDFYGMRLSDAVMGAGLGVVAASMLRGAAVLAIARAAGWRGLKLAAALFVFVFSTTTLMVVVEAVYLPDSLPPAIIVPLTVNGAIAAAVVSGAVAALPLPALPSSPAVIRSPRWGYLWRLPVLGVLWGVLFVIFGALIFLPLAGILAPDALAQYTNLDMPAWVLPFQVGRGIMWALLALPMLWALRAGGVRRLRMGVLLGLAMAALMGGNMLMVTGLPWGLQAAHLLEVSGESFALGMLFGWLL